MIFIVFVLLNVNPIIDKIKPQLTDIISKSIGKPISIENINLKIFPQSSLELSKTKIGSDNDNKSLVLEKILLKTNLFALLQKKVEITEFELADANIDIRKEKDGTLYAGELPLNKPATTPQEEKRENLAAKDTPNNSSTETTSSTTTVTEAENKISLLIKEASIKNSKITYKDLSLPSPLDISIQDIDLSLENINGESIDSISLDATVLSDERHNLKLRGKVNKNENSTISGDTELGLRNINLEEIKKLMTSYGTDPTSQGLEIQNKLSLSTKINVIQNVINLNLLLDATDASIIFKNIFKKEAKVPFSVAVNSKDISKVSNKEVDKLEVTLGELTLNSPLNINYALNKDNKNEMSALIANFSTENFKLNELSKYVPLLADYNLLGELNSKLKIDHKKDSTIPNLNGNFDLKSLSTSIKNSSGEAIKIENLNLTSKFDGLSHDLDFNNFFSGQLKIKGKIEDNNILNTNISASAINIANLLNTLNPASKAKITGNLDTLNIGVKGPTNALADKAAGNLETKLSKGDISGFNILGATLGKISQLPLIGGVLTEALPPQFRPVIEKNSTAFDSLTLSASYSGKNININKLNLEHSLYIVSGTGKILANGDMEINSQLKLTTLLSNSIVERQPKFKLLLDSNNQIEIPLIITKSNNTFLVLPDVSKLGKSALGNTIKNSATKALDKVAPGIGGVLDKLF